MALPELGSGVKLGRKRAAHLLRRATFGATKQQIDHFADLDAIDAINELYPSASLPDPALPLDPKTGQEWVLTGVTDANSKDDELCNYFKGWFIAQMLNPSVAYSAREKIVLFYHTHFTAIQSKIGSSRALYFQNQLFRLFALDANDPDLNFKSLTVKVSVDNAMLRLLDGNLNVKGSVNENYARELLELYSIGRGLEANPPVTSGDQGDYGVYRETDVQTAARILSGWNFDEDFNTIDADTSLARGKVKGSAANASSHDNDLTKPKQFSDRFASTLFPGNIIEPDPGLMPGGVATEASALDEITKMIDLIYEQPETARNICRKIYRFFVWAPHTNEEVLQVEVNAIDMMVQTFNTNFKIQPVIENLLRSQHFYEATSGVTDDNFGGLIKSPLDLVVGTLRFFNVELPDMQTQTIDFYKATNDILGTIKDHGMDFYEPYDVAGYDAYHQFPIYHRFWITTNSLAKRYDFIRQLFRTESTSVLNVDAYEFVKNNFPDEAPDSNLLLKELISYLLPHHDYLTYNELEETSAIDKPSITTKRLTYFKNRFLSDISSTPETYWTETWTLGTDLGDLRLWLNLLFGAILQSPEYQLA
jgi:uncharacterized protein (DUF1800 family)